MNDLPPYVPCVEENSNRLLALTIFSANNGRKNRHEILKTRQELLDLLEESKWDLVTERYYEASEKIDKIKTLADQLMVELLMSMADALKGSK